MHSFLMDMISLDSHMTSEDPNPPPPLQINLSHHSIHSKLRMKLIFILFFVKSACNNNTFFFNKVQNNTIGFKSSYNFM